MTQVSFKFGDSRELCDQLLALVRSGAKTATCGALRDFDDAEPVPQVGRRDVALDWDGNPALIIETTEVTLRRFCDVPEDFALAEGEGDFDDWRQGHIAYFSRNGGYDPDMVLVCERFRLVEVLA
ncbi:ASCH domain-containing protein [Paracoccus sp. PAR01]|uniref:ASCH domain-containing protein n=1 Tax=Paracoccus sp. PAR01 TaxID=2769282 RepID=UPI00177C424F|nr:ASCH domain-containing protein [Paracoccus sp. PAR01]MBD9526684.1 ASCH domain-containing protein [Paracoccus sp. PAR01]